MPRTNEPGLTVDLLRENTPASFWRLTVDVPEALWTQEASGLLDGDPGAGQALAEYGWAGLMAHWLGEGQFGPDHWRLGAAKRAYYGWIRGLIPPLVKPVVRRVLARTGRRDEGLGWPVEPRYADFMRRLVGCVLRSLGTDHAEYIHFWPEGRQFALVLTHDVEGPAGLEFVPAVAELEELLGFRSCFNFVPEAYRVDEGLLADLTARGFEVGVHGLLHDGRLFSNRSVFQERAEKINRYLKRWDAHGFRAPLMHRHPEWLQALDVDYDCSFFDTDPYEPLGGGTMSAWPFLLGRFVELPYTLVQDHTLLETLQETTPRLWLEKLEFLRRVCGMALVNTHPDYLRRPPGLEVYREFLERMASDGGRWSGLPGEAARWWRARAAGTGAAMPAGGIRGQVTVDGERVHLHYADRMAPETDQSATNS